MERDNGTKYPKAFLENTFKQFEKAADAADMTLDKYVKDYDAWATGTTTTAGEKSNSQESTASSSKKQNGNHKTVATKILDLTGEDDEATLDEEEDQARQGALALRRLSEEDIMAGKGIDAFVKPERG